MRLRNYYKQKDKPYNRPPPPQHLRPVSVQLVDWETLKVGALNSYLPDEGTQRAGLIEEYLWGYINILRQRNKDASQINWRIRTSFLRDEEEERRFIAEDGDCFALRSFITETEKAAIEVIESWEAQSREALLTAHKEYLAESFAILEEIHRMHVATQAFDSCFLKRCQINPHWMWRKLQFIEDGARERAVRQAQLEVMDMEKAERRKMIATFNENYVLGFLSIAFVEKVDMYEKHRIDFTDSCRDILEDSAIKIQAAFRGYISRRHHPWW